MKSSLRIVLLAAFAHLSYSGLVGAQDIPNDSDNYQGDRISFEFDLHGLDTDPPDPAGKKTCVGAGMSLRVVGQSADKLIVVIIGDPAKYPCKIDPTKEAPPVKQQKYVVTKTDIKTTPPNRFGMSFGVLAIPFKYQLTGDHNNSGSATLGGYIGRRFDKSSTLGFSIEPILFAGASNVSVPQTTGGQTSSQDVAGISLGIGLVGTIKGNFQAGVVLGWDHVSKSSQYQYNNKPWLALEVGFTFLK